MIDILFIISIIATVIITGLLIWAAVALKTIETQQKIMEDIIKEWTKSDE